MEDTDRDYYRARIEIEQERGERATDPVIAKVHLTLAEMYRTRIADAERVSQPKLRIVA